METPLVLVVGVRFRVRGTRVEVHRIVQSRLPRKPDRGNELDGNLEEPAIDMYSYVYMLIDICVSVYKYVFEIGFVGSPIPLQDFPGVLRQEAEELNWWPS